MSRYGTSLRLMLTLDISHQPFLEHLQSFVGPQTDVPFTDSVSRGWMASQIPRTQRIIFRGEVSTEMISSCVSKADVLIDGTSQRMAQMYEKYIVCTMSVTGSRRERGGGIHGSNSSADTKARKMVQSILCSSRFDSPLLIKDDEINQFDC